jgi:hypothetical protein
LGSPMVIGFYFGLTRTTASNLHHPKATKFNLGHPKATNPI